MRRIAAFAALLLAASAAASVEPYVAALHGAKCDLEPSGALTCRYRYQMLATRFHSYCGNWERLMRQIEEGKFVRKLESLRGGNAALGPSRKEECPPPPQSEAERISAEIAAISGKAPDRQKIATFLAEQRAQLSSRFAGRDIEFLVLCEDGKPKLKARPKV
jgi:hypothetical protein